MKVNGWIWMCFNLWWFACFSLIMKLFCKGVSRKSLKNKSHFKWYWWEDNRNMKFWIWSSTTHCQQILRRLSEVDVIDTHSSLQWNGAIIIACVVCVMLLGVGGWIYWKQRSRKLKYFFQSHSLSRKQTHELDPFVLYLSALGRKIKHDRGITENPQIIISQAPSKRIRSKFIQHRQGQ